MRSSMVVLPLPSGRPPIYSVAARLCQGTPSRVARITSAPRLLCLVRSTALSFAIGLLVFARGPPGPIVAARQRGMALLSAPIPPSRSEHDQLILRSEQERDDTNCPPVETCIAYNREQNRAPRPRLYASAHPGNVVLVGTRPSHCWWVSPRPSWADLAHALETAITSCSNDREPADDATTHHLANRGDELKTRLT